MSSRVESSQLTTTKKVNFARLSRVVIDLFARIMRDILLFYYPYPEDLQKKIEETNLEHKFRNDIERIFNGDGYEKCDVSLLHKLIRNTCHIIPPTVTNRRRGWGGDKIPSRECTTLGDEIERMRIIRNRICGHIHKTEIEDNELEKYMGISYDICQRMKGSYGTNDYLKELETIRTCRMENDMLVTLTEEVKEDIERNEELRNYVREESKKINEKMDKLLEEMEKIKSEQASKTVKCFVRNKEGRITSLTDSGWEIIRKNTESEYQNKEFRENSRVIVNEIAEDICRRDGCMNLQKLETHFRNIFQSPFKSKMGTKLLHYLQGESDKFTVCNAKGNQKKVMLTGNELKITKHKKCKQKRNQSIGKPVHIEEFDVKLVFPYQESDKWEICKIPLQRDKSASRKESTNSSDQELQTSHCSIQLQSDDRNWDDDEKEFFALANENEFVEEDEFLTSSENKPTESRNGQNNPCTQRYENTLNLTIQNSSETSYRDINRKLHEKGLPFSNPKLHLKKFSQEAKEMKKENTHESLPKGEENYQTVSSKSPEEISKSISQFLDKVHNFGKSSESFALVVGKTNIVPKIESLALIPWLCVFDFDIHSREDGLMSVLEGHIRTIHPCTWKDRPRFSFSYTYWCQLRGDSQVPDTCITADVKSWMKLVRPDVEEHLRTLSQYISNNTVLKVVLIWPEQDDDMRFIHRFLIKLEDNVEPLPEIFVIYPNMRNESPYMSQIEPTFKLQLPLGSFYSYLKTNLNITMPKKFQLARYRLPTYDKTNDPGIDEYTASHLQEDLNILYLNDVHRSQYDVYDIKEEGENFLRGGTLRWFVYYESESLFDVKRDQMDKILHDIRNVYINRSLSAIIEVYHLPGAGGTTLSQRILWELHKEVPCVQVKSNFQSTTSDIVEHIKLLFEKTNLPILILLDGRDDSEVIHLYKQLKLFSVSVIVLHVQRFRQELKDEKLETGKYWVKGHVSKREATQFCIRYLEFCDTDEKKENLESITDDVGNGQFHQVYEFGLTTFAHEYKGVDAYVKGYLQLLPESRLDVTQKLLGYLSLVYFYGQMSVPCELFSKLLNKRKGITFDDLPFAVRQLVVRSNNHQHIGFIRICHQIVAKEILEQILTRNVPRLEKPSSQNLSQEACKNLGDFGVEFIKDMKAKNEGVKIPWGRNIIVEILAKTFLHRDAHDIGEYNFQKRKPKFSRFFTDIEKHTSKHDRIRIMANLTSCFPQNPNYHAHLGRMYTLYFPGEEDETAEKHFKKAISLCEKEQKSIGKGKSTTFEEQCTHSSVYHMYGMHFYHRICRVTRDSNIAMPNMYHLNVETVLEYASNACLHFETARENSFPGLGELYGLTGEIMVRTEVCNYINKNLEMRLSDFIKSPTSAVVIFVRESMVHICDLITRCYSTTDEDEIPFSMSRFVILYKELFQGQEMAQLCSFDGPMDYTKRRHLVTQIKLKFDRYNILSLNNKTPSRDIHDIVFNLEGNFTDLEIKGPSKLNKGPFESDFKDWLNAIRLEQFDEDIDLESVMRRVYQWHELVNTPTSKFYVFVMCSLLTLLKKDTNRFIEAKDMLDEVKKYKNHFMKPHKPREWLGVGSGIKCLIPGLFLKRKDDSSFNEIELDCSIAVRPMYLKGTISGSNKRPLSGFISLDVCNISQFDVFFVPVRTKEKLIGSTYSNQRVEFILGFNASHGFIAFNVKRLEKVVCDNCQRKIEFVTDQLIATCKCGKTVQKIIEEDVFYPEFD